MALAMGVMTLSAQVKKQFQDDTYAQTTIVIKDDAAGDLDILNSQFDLDEIGMDQVIRITTEAERPVVQAPTTQQPQQIITAQVSKKAPEAGPTKPAMTRWSVRPKTTKTKKVAEVSKTAGNKAANSVKGATAYASSSTSMANNKTVNRSSPNAKRAKPAFNMAQYKKFKPKKRKKVKRSRRSNKISCFKF